MSLLLNVDMYVVKKDTDWRFSILLILAMYKLGYEYFRYFSVVIAHFSSFRDMYSGQEDVDDGHLHPGVHCILPRVRMPHVTATNTS